MGANPELRKQYRATWDVFARKLDMYQSYVEARDSVRAEAALLEVEKARMAHNAARDLLAQHLTNTIAATDVKWINALKSIKVPERQRVRATAHILWEIAGKPSGTADSDWRRAETLVRTASASCC